MEKRVILAVVLSFVVLYVYQAMFAPKPVPRPKAAQTEMAKGAVAPAAGQSSTPGTAAQRVTGAPAGAAGAPAAAAPVTPAAGADAAASQAATAAATPQVQTTDTEERDVVIDTPTLRAVFTNRGAALRSWRLKTYRDKAGTPVDLVPQTLAGAARPFQIETGNGAVDARANAALFRVDGGGAAQDARTGAWQAAFEYREAGGLSVRKVFTIDPQRFTIRAVISAEVAGSPADVGVVMGPGPGDVETSESSRYQMGARANLYREGKVERRDAGALLNLPLAEGQMRWAGVDDHYFLSAALLGENPARVEYKPLTIQDNAGKPLHTFISYTVNPKADRVDTTFFIGPKAFDLLKGLDGQLVRAIDYGMFAWLVVPLLGALNWVNAFIGNYGWSIIVLTFLINLAIFPLRHKSVVSMRKMQELQPEIKAIQDRYGKLKATDPAKQKMNQELMELYKQRGVNPASGCVPMLLTMPILFAFYSMLAYSIELRGAPFGLWIKDLSRYDPFYVAPILTGITMLVQQKMTPQTGTDPMQQKMFMMMPVVFTVMFLWAPSGLNIYWLVNNVLAIAQQYFTNRLIGPSRVPRPVAEKRPAKKSDGSV
jgi:YidC/Oxa1 family membrane protein insertase